MAFLTLWLNIGIVILGLMTFLLRNVSGVAMLEKTLTNSKPGYAGYLQEVPAFFPRLWRKN